MVRLPRTLGESRERSILPYGRKELSNMLCGVGQLGGGQIYSILDIINGSVEPPNLGADAVETKYT